MPPVDDIQNGLDRIWSSDFVQKNPKKSYQAYHPDEYNAVKAYVEGGAEPNSWPTTLLGEGLALVEKGRRALAAPEPEPEPVPPAFVNSSIKAGQTLKGNVMWAVETSGDVAKVEFWANNLKLGEDVTGT